MTRKSPIKHPIKAYKRKNGTYVKPSIRGSGTRPSLRQRKIIPHTLFQNVNEIGQSVSTLNSYIGEVSAIVKTPQELKKLFPKDYDWLSYVALKMNKQTMSEWTKRFPLYLIDTKNVKYYYIYANDKSTYTFSDPISHHELFNRLVEKSNIFDKTVKYITHRTSKKNLSSILSAGLEPRVNTGFHELSGSYSMGVGNTSNKFNDIEIVGGDPRDVIIVYRKTTEKPILKETGEHRRLLGIYDGIRTWYIARDTIKPTNIDVVYDLKGNVVWKSNK